MDTPLPQTVAKKMMQMNKLFTSFMVSKLSAHDSREGPKTDWFILCQPGSREKEHTFSGFILFSLSSTRPAGTSTLRVRLPLS